MGQLSNCTGLLSARQIILTAFLCFAAGCDTGGVLPRPSNPELERGLVMLFPGGSSIPEELSAWVAGLRAGGIDLAIDVVAWGDQTDSLGNVTDMPRARERAALQAQRILDYKTAYANRPVTVVGYSAGAAIATFTVEALPPGVMVDRLVLMSADLSPEYDLSPALDHTRLDLVNYWSPLDYQSLILIQTIGTVDGSKVPAASVNFNETDAKYTPIMWHPVMAIYGNFGGHLDYLFNVGFIKDFLSPYIVTTTE